VSWINSITYSVSTIFSKITGNHKVRLKGLPFDYLVALDPKKLFAVYTKYKIKKASGDVNLKLGPIDNVAGRFHLDTGDIEVDVLEIAMAKTKHGTPEELDREVTRTLAHESRHSWQRQNYSKFIMKWDQFAILIGLMATAIWLILFPMFLGAARLVLSGGLLVILGFVAFYGVYFLFRTAFTLSSMVAYSFCWIERDARRFADEAVNDPEWMDVIDVSIANAPTPQEMNRRIHDLLGELIGKMGLPGLDEEMAKRLSKSLDNDTKRAEEMAAQINKSLSGEN